ncbi:phosphate ABC transporter permease subunit PstC [Campylobacter sp. 7477a]|uniref:phosphate ABC transporter permease subunit PstC n=1 Tax=Campylobacter sp. 7477a TaxID=2735741 RepID=UPI003014CCC0|nr:phosphate ABC transporter permease subunit PstC [Campylobacter sp. 7477a]
MLPLAQTKAKKWLLNLKQNSKEIFTKSLLFVATLVSILTTFGILFVLLFEAMLFFSRESVSYFFTGKIWSPDGAFGADGGMFGALPLFSGTFYITAIAMLVAIPVGIFSAIYLSEYASNRAKNILKPVLEILAGIPTIVYGVFAALIVSPMIVDAAAKFGVSASYESALGAGFVMGVMITPIIASLCDDALSSVPKSLEFGSLALGMTRSETILFVTIPTAMPGIIAACLLGVSRALGETMIVVMAASLRANLSLNPLEDMTTVTVKIVEALTGDKEFDSSLTLSAFGLGLTLFVVTLLINLVSVKISNDFHKRYKISNL